MLTLALFIIQIIHKDVKIVKTIDKIFDIQNSQQKTKLSVSALS